MKQKIPLWALLMLPTTLFAMDCGYLGISFVNASGEKCVLRNAQGYGLWSIAEVPKEIQAGETTTMFYMQQMNYAGPSMDFDYRCGQNEVAFFSVKQNYCALEAGNIIASVYEGNDRSVEYKITSGSFWSGLPGQVQWIIH